MSRGDKAWPENTTGGRKDDGGKLPWHLLPYDAVEDIVAVLDFGAKKYNPRNWEKGIVYSRVFGALMRHLVAWWMRENGGRDKETGFSHLAHAGCCVLFLLAFEKRTFSADVELDDRPETEA